MMGGVTMAEPIISLAEAQAFARIETGDEEALIAGFIRTASSLCESFINQIVIARSFSVTVPGSADWARLPVSPVQSITDVSAVAPDASSTPLQQSEYAIDIDSSGDGWIRLECSGNVGRLRVTGSAGMAADENCVPEPIRQGVMRLVSHLFTVRDAPDGELPAAVTALWRPYRHMRLGQ